MTHLDILYSLIQNGYFPSIAPSYIRHVSQSHFKAKTIPTIGLIHVSSYLKPSLRNATFIMLLSIVESKYIANIRIVLVVAIDGVKGDFNYVSSYKLLDFRQLGFICGFT